MKWLVIFQNVDNEPNASEKVDLRCLVGFFLFVFVFYGHFIFGPDGPYVNQSLDWLIPDILFNKKMAI